MVDLNQIFGEIESRAFALEQNTASTLPSLLRGLDSSKEMKELRKALVSSRSAEEVLVTRIDQLVLSSFDKRYENPADVALAAYLRALALHSSPLAPLAAETALTAASLWWAPRVAELIQSDFATTQIASRTHAPTVGPAGMPILVYLSQTKVRDDHLFSLSNRKPGSSVTQVYFSGHGYPDPDTNAKQMWVAETKWARHSLASAYKSYPVISVTNSVVFASVSHTLVSYINARNWARFESHPIHFGGTIRDRVSIVATSRPSTSHVIQRDDRNVDLAWTAVDTAKDNVVG